MIPVVTDRINKPRRSYWIAIKFQRRRYEQLKEGMLLLPLAFILVVDLEKVWYYGNMLTW